MDRPRLIRGLRIAWSVWWGIFCAVFVVLWVRSFDSVDVFYGQIPLVGTFKLHSIRGNFVWRRGTNNVPWGFSSSSYDEWQQREEVIQNFKAAPQFAFVGQKVL